MFSSREEGKKKGIITASNRIKVKILFEQPFSFEDFLKRCTCLKKYETIL